MALLTCVTNRKLALFYMWSQIFCYNMTPLPYIGNVYTMLCDIYGFHLFLDHCFKSIKRNALCSCGSV